MPTTPYAKSVFPWLRANLGQTALAPLTSTDTQALQAAVQIVPLWDPYSFGNADGQIAAAFGACVRRMQPHTRQFAFHAIAHVSEWSTRFKLWRAAGFDELPSPCYRCKHEPRPVTAET